MVFSSLEFLFIFLPAFMLVYGLVPKKYKNATIFAGSVIFYSVGVISRPVYILLFLLTILFNFIIGEFIYNFRKASKLWLTVGIVFNFWWLIFFKYTGFLFENINALFHAHLPVKDIILPIGISFYTFQSVSYLIDVYRRRARAESNFISYGAYISMFPQLIAGPIVKFRIVSRMLRHRKHTAAMIEEGLKTFTIGLGFKVLIANQIGGLWSDIGNIGFHSISAPLAWMGIIAYSFQLYFDFCGYSYMAIGLGKIMGFELPKNFDHPYMSLTMGEFWRRWHMTLGMWFREYIYIPLGGSRCGKLKTIRNYFIVWAFTGLWHGASWNFIIWGMVLFALIMLERFVIGKYLERFKVLGHLYMLFVIPLTWLIFAVTDISQLGVYFCRLLPFIPQQTYPVLEHDYLKYLGIYWKFFLAGAVFSTDLPERIYKKIKDTIAIKLVLLAVFWLSVYCIYKGMNDPFMYFRF
ncbi:MAG: MBOAT family protein [Ruminococcus sp.]|nr:MBOAT family protein [Ruminococcus sp.]